MPEQKNSLGALDFPIHLRLPDHHCPAVFHHYTMGRWSQVFSGYRLQNYFCVSRILRLKECDSLICIYFNLNYAFLFLLYFIVVSYDERGLSTMEMIFYFEIHYSIACI